MGFLTAIYGEGGGGGGGHYLFKECFILLLTDDITYLVYIQENNGQVSKNGTLYSIKDSSWGAGVELDLTGQYVNSKYSYFPLHPVIVQTTAPK